MLKNKIKTMDVYSKVIINNSRLGRSSWQGGEESDKDDSLGKYLITHDDKYFFEFVLCQELIVGFFKAQDQSYST